MSISVVDRATRRAVWRILPLLFCCYVVAYVDRANVGYAKLTMSRDLPAFDNGVIGMGSGLFFVGYFLLEIPGTLIVERWSARRWIARIMVTWGVIAGATAFVRTPGEFYGARFLLGLAEAGFFPGVVVYLTHWFPVRTRGRVMSVFLVATPVAQLVAPKVCNALLGIERAMGLKGWQWVYVGWGMPAVVLGVLVWWWLPDRPGDASWLSEEEREALEGDLAADLAEHGTGGRHVSVWEAMKHPGTLLVAVVLFAIAASNYALDTFLPTMLRDWYGLSRDAITWWLLLPPVCALMGVVVVGWSSDRFRERRLHTAGCVMLAGAALLVVPFTQGVFVLTMVCVSTYAAGNKGSQPPMWAMPSLMLTGSAAAASTGLINSVGNLGGFVGPMVLGRIESKTGSFLPGLYGLAALLVGAGVVLGCVKVVSKK